jgi:hypothetical protein
MDKQICDQRRTRARHVSQRTEESVTEKDRRASLQTSAELIRTYGAIVDAITATAIDTQAGLDWLGAQPPDLKEVRRSLINISNNSKRAGEIIVRFRMLLKMAPEMDGAPDS